MSKSIVKTIAIAPETTFEDIFHYTIESFVEYFDGVGAVETKNSRDLLVTGRPKTKFFPATLSIQAKVLIQDKEHKIKISLDSKNKLNAWFWLSLLISCPFPIYFVFLIYDYGSSKKLIDAALENAMNRIDAKLSDF